MGIKTKISGLALLFLFVLMSQAYLYSQSLTIDAGSPSDQYYTCGSTCYAFTNSSLASQSGVYRTLRSSNPGTPITYTIPVVVGSTCSTKLDLIEPRLAGSGPGQSAVGTRIFTATVNGATSGPIDIFASAGALTPFIQPLQAVVAPTGQLTIMLAATVGHPVVSGLEIACIPPPPPPPQLGNCTISGAFTPGTILVARQWPDGSCHLEGAIPSSLQIVAPLTQGLPPMLAPLPTPAPAPATITPTPAPTQ